VVIELTLQGGLDKEEQHDERTGNEGNQGDNDNQTGGGGNGDNNNGNISSNIQSGEYHVRLTVASSTSI
jgi:hypothetical protein